MHSSLSLSVEKIKEKREKEKIQTNKQKTKTKDEKRSAIRNILLPNDVDFPLLLSNKLKVDRNLLLFNPKNHITNASSVT